MANARDRPSESAITTVAYASLSQIPLSALISLSRAVKEMGAQPGETRGLSTRVSSGAWPSMLDVKLDKRALRMDAVYRQG
jgi:hypothetical protein